MSRYENYACRKDSLLKNGLISCPGIVNHVKRFEESGSLEDRPRTGSHSLARGRITAGQTTMNDLAAESSTMCSIAHKAEG